jgi:PAS domain S-box-containing protein
VWLADDSPWDVEHTRGVLVRGGYTPETFPDGESLLEQLGLPGVAQPDLVLLDWLMPGCSGLEVCRFLRERYGLAELPVLLLTASTHEGALEEAFGAGASDYVAKPARPVELLARVRALLQASGDAKALRAREREQAQLLAEARVARAEADEERTRLTNILATLEEAVLLHDAGGVLRFCNPAAERLLGLTSEQMAGRTPADARWEVTWPDGRSAPAEERPSLRALRTGERVTGEVLGVRHSDGRRVWLSVNARPSFERDGTTPSGVVTSFFDITARLDAERAREELLDALSHQSLFGVVLFKGPGLVFERANAPYRHLVGGRDVQGKPLLEAVPELVGQGFDTLLHEVRRTGTAVIRREAPGRVDRSGSGVLEEGYYDYVFQPVCSADGTCEDVLHLALDVTEGVRARKEAERMVALEREHAGFEQKLIGIVGHDLRQPLQTISMAATLLMRHEPQDERTRRSASRILRAADRTTGMLRDILDFTQARLGGGIVLRPEAVDLAELARATADEAEATHGGRQVQVSVEGDSMGVWDADRLLQVLDNLLANALTHGAAGVPVRLGVDGRAPDVTVLQVHNAGAPIPRELQAQLFEAMKRGSGSASASRSVGLGLFIVRHLVERHGGTVEVASAAGEGTTFTVRLPRGAPGSALSP